MTIRACARGQFPSWFSEEPHFNFGRQAAHIVNFLVLTLSLHHFKMAESTKSTTKRAEGCGHPIFDWDSHKYCFPCRDKGKGEDICATQPQEDCYTCISFTTEQKRKLVSKNKKKEKVKEVPSLSQEIEDSLLQEDSSSTASAPDPLAVILSKLNDMQGKIKDLESRERAQFAPIRVETGSTPFTRQTSVNSSAARCSTRDELEEGDTSEGHEEFLQRTVDGQTAKGSSASINFTRRIPR